MSEMPAFPYGAVYFRKSNPPPEDWAREYRDAANLELRWPDDEPPLRRAGEGAGDEGLAYLSSQNSVDIVIACVQGGVYPLSDFCIAMIPWRRQTKHRYESSAMICCAFS